MRSDLLYTPLTKLISQALLSVASLLLFGLAAAAQGQESNPAFETGCARMGHHDFDGAVESFTEVIAMDSKYTKAYFMRGQAFYQLKDYRRAIEDFTRSISLNGQDSDSYLWRGAAESRSGQDADAVDDYEKAIRLNPQLVKNYDAGPGKPGGSSESTSTSNSSSKVGTSARQNERSVQNYEAAIQRVKANP
jgi:tetratricopeptide (TPR) repeat protein